MSSNQTKHGPTMRVLAFLLDVVELYLPMASFVMLFVLFVINVFFRYVLNAPLTWPYELITLGFVWTAIFGATYVRRIHGHVQFTLVYDGVSPKTQRIFRILANSAVALAFAIAFPATLDWVLFMGFKKSANLQIPFSIAFFPVVVFLVLIGGHSLYDVVIDIREARRDAKAEHIR